MSSVIKTDGAPCKKCGRAARYEDGRCAPCQLSANARWRERNREKVLASKKEYYEANKDYLLAKARDWADKNPQKRRQIELRYRIVNAEKELARCALWRRNNPEKKYAAKARRRANALKAVPKWYGEFDGFVIEEAARLARARSDATGFTWHVDHTIPLQSPRVCGLHIAPNLGVIPGAENIRKGNRYWPGISILPKEEEMV